jgi:hypothetical protein
VSEGRAVFVLALLVGSIVAGAVVQRVTDSGVRESPYSTLDRIEEPAAAADVALALSNGDPKSLSRLMDNQSLTALRDALVSPMGAPISDVRSVKFVGATAKGTRVLAGYVLNGKDMQGSDAIVGFVLDVENGQIVGVN